MASPFRYLITALLLPIPPQACADEAKSAEKHFRIEQLEQRWAYVGPDGAPFLATGINHIDGLRFATEDWPRYWDEVLAQRLQDWNCNVLGYGTPPALRGALPWFASFGLVPIEKHRSVPRPGDPNSFAFPDVFDAEWAQKIDDIIRTQTKAQNGDPKLLGYFWTDTPTLDLLKTRALRGTDWVSETRELPIGSPGRQAYVEFLQARYEGRLEALNEIYSLDLERLDDLGRQGFGQLPVGRHRVQEDDEAFFALLLKRYYEVAGSAQRRHSPDHLVYGDRFLIGDTPEAALEAIAPWVDAIAVQPGDRYSRLYPASTTFVEEEYDRIHAITGKPILICDHAISYPSPAGDLTIFESLPDEDAAVAATEHFVDAAFAKPYIIGYLRCQYIDRPARFGRGLRQGLVTEEDEPRPALVGAYQRAFERAHRQLHR